MVVPHRWWMSNSPTRPRCGMHVGRNLARTWPHRSALSLRPPWPVMVRLRQGGGRTHGRRGDHYVDQAARALVAFRTTPTCPTAVLRCKDVRCSSLHDADLADAVVTLDALHAQREHARASAQVALPP